MKMPKKQVPLYIRQQAMKSLMLGIVMSVDPEKATAHVVPLYGGGGYIEARCLHTRGSDEYGIVSLPEVKDLVVVFLADDRPDSAFILGCVYNDRSKIPPEGKQRHDILEKSRTGFWTRMRETQADPVNPLDPDDPTNALTTAEWHHPLEMSLVVSQPDKDRVEQVFSHPKDYQESVTQPDKDRVEWHRNGPIDFEEALEQPDKDRVEWSRTHPLGLVEAMEQPAADRVTWKIEHPSGLILTIEQPSADHVTWRMEHPSGLVQRVTDTDDGVAWELSHPGGTSMRIGEDGTMSISTPPEKPIELTGAIRSSIPTGGAGALTTAIFDGGTAAFFGGGADMAADNALVRKCDLRAAIEGHRHTDAETRSTSDGWPYEFSEYPASEYGRMA